MAYLEKAQGPGPGPWACAHGLGPWALSPCRWARALGPGPVPMDPGPGPRAWAQGLCPWTRAWVRAHGPAPMGPWAQNECFRRKNAKNVLLPQIHKKTILFCCFSTIFWRPRAPQPQRCLIAKRVRQIFVHFRVRCKTLTGTPLKGEIGSCLTLVINSRVCKCGHER